MSQISPKLLVTVLAGLAILVIGWQHEHQSPPIERASYASSQASRPAAGAEPVVVVVDITGAVRHAGVYRLPSGARVQDAVRRARPLPSADVSAVNLAARLTDGQQVVIPRRGETVAADGGGGSAAPAAPISLNSGTLEQLETLDGIGPSLAQRIIDYRTSHGGFRSIAELDQFSGFGPARLAALHGHVTL